MRISVIFFSIALLFLSPVTARARQGADATALTLESGNLGLRAHNVAILLDDRLVQVTVDIENSGSKKKTLGFYAHTPFFWYRGMGDEYQDKRFLDVVATLNGNKINPIVRQRGIHLGQDITSLLSSRGLAPLPDNNASELKIMRLPLIGNMRPIDWQGFMTYSWTFSAPRESNSKLAFSYLALPEYIFVGASNVTFSRKIKQHCGNVDEVLDFIKSIALEEAIEGFIVNRYEIPISFMQNKSISLTIKQPAINWQGARPIISLVCGDSLTNKLVSSFTDTVTLADDRISILVISLPSRVVK